MLCVALGMPDLCYCLQGVEGCAAMLCVALGVPYYAVEMPAWHRLALWLLLRNAGAAWEGGGQDSAGAMLGQAATCR